MGGKYPPQTPPSLKTKYPLKVKRQEPTAFSSSSQDGQKDQKVPMTNLQPDPSAR